MDMFEDAKIGDLVHCLLRGDGVITSVTYSERYMLECSFEYEKHTPYDYSGRSSKELVEPTLFYRKGEERYLEKRPEPELEIDWSKVPTGPNGVKVRLRDSDSEEFGDPRILMAYIPDYKFRFFVAKYEFTTVLTGFRQAILAEPLKEEWVKR